MNEHGRNITVNGITYMPINTVADTAFNWSIGWLMVSLPIGSLIVYAVLWYWSEHESRKFERKRRENEIKEARARLSAAIAAGDDEKTINDYQRALTFMEVRYGA